MTTARQRSGILGVSKLRRVLRRIPAEYTEAVKLVVWQYGQQVLADARHMAPKRTGTLARELRVVYSRDGLTARIGIIGKRSLKRAWYGIYVEFGNSKMQPRPFLRTAWRQNVNPFIRDINKAIDKSLDSFIEAPR